MIGLVSAAIAILTTPQQGGWGVKVLRDGEVPSRVHFKPLELKLDGWRRDLIELNWVPTTPETFPTPRQAVRYRYRNGTNTLYIVQTARYADDPPHPSYNAYRLAYFKVTFERGEVLWFLDKKNVSATLVLTQGSNKLLKQIENALD